jgi:ferredoxin--NADP+ reductase
MKQKTHHQQIVQEGSSMKLEDLDLGTTFAAEVVATRLLTVDGAAEEVRELVLELDTGQMEFHVGQSIAVLAPGDRAFGHKEHVRLYTIADAPQLNQVKPEITICVRRCHYVDDFSGEAFDGIASNYLCDRQVGDGIQVAGPFGLPFVLPEDRNATLLMIGLGTGIAPFRALVRHIFSNLGGWPGKVRIFHGAHTGLEMLYRNDQVNDFAQYMDDATFAAFEAVSPRPAWGEPVDFDAAFKAHEVAIKALLEAPDTYVYVAGLAPVREHLDEVFASLVGGTAAWTAKKQKLIDEKRWSELIY